MKLYVNSLEMNLVMNSEGEYWYTSETNNTILDA